VLLYDLHVTLYCIPVPVLIPQVKQLADLQTAELNAKVLQLESHIHWLQRDNARLQEELQQARQAAVGAGGAAAAAAGGAQASAALQVRRMHMASSSARLYRSSNGHTATHGWASCWRESEQLQAYGLDCGRHILLLAQLRACLLPALNLLLSKQHSCPACCSVPCDAAAGAC
jgi:hypothetical protein